MDRDTGVVSTAGVFAGLSGIVHRVEVEAFDNFGNPPTNRRTGILTVSLFVTWADSYSSIHVVKDSQLP